MTNLASLSAADLDALLAQAKAAKAALVDRENARLGALLSEFVTTVTSESEPEPSAKSTWIGWKAYGVPVTIDGKAYTVAVTITDTAAKAARAQATDAPAPEPEPEPEPESESVSLVKAAKA